MTAQPAQIIAADPGRLWSVWAPISLALAFWWTQARYGFNPTDDGFVLAQSWRILQGEIPHLDFTSPRPLGSAFLHLPEVLVPYGMIAVSRLVVVLQYLWIAIATVDFAASRRWCPTPLQRFCLIALAFLLNLGLWPVMPWHTVDGIFLSVTALWLATRAVRSERATYMKWSAIWILAGLAPLMKQGFALAALLIALLALTTRQRQGIVTAPLVVVPALLYWTLTLGTPGGILAQIHGGSSDELLLPIRSLAETLGSVGGLAAIACAITARALVRWNRGPDRVRTPFSVMLFVAPALLVGLQQGMWLSSTWSFIAVLSFITVATPGMLRPPTAILTICMLGLSYAVSISWGVPAPGLLAGSVLAAGVLVMVKDAGSLDPDQLPRGFTAGVVIAAVSAVLVVSYSRIEQTYAELPRTGLVSSVEAPSFSLVAMSPQSAAYLNEVRDCLAKYPAERVAVLPDGPGLYPFLGLHNPFGSDWWYAPERTPGHDALTAAAVSRLNEQGSWLVLFQSFGAFGLSAMPVERVTAPGPPFEYVEGDIRVLERLSGTPVQCGSLSGEWMPVAHP